VFPSFALLMLKLYIVIYNFKEICNKGCHPGHPFLNLSIQLGRESSCQFHFTTLLMVLMGISVQVEERRKGTENVALRLCYSFCILFPIMPALLKYVSLLVNFLALFVLSILYKYVFWCCELSVQFLRKFWHGVDFTWGVAENMQR
jgi:presenilin-like A22 family membrane protease